jgi:hypothetical protein
VYNNTVTLEEKQVSEKKIQIVCGHCGSADVRRDAWAEWDVDKQDWVGGEVFDDGHCATCEGESRLEEMPLDEWEKLQGETQVLEAKEYHAEELPDGNWKGVIADEDVGVIGEVTHEPGLPDWPLTSRDEALDAARKAIMQEEF